MPCLQFILCYREAFLISELMGQSIQHALHCASRIPYANIRPIWLLVIPNEYDLIGFIKPINPLCAARHACAQGISRRRTQMKLN